MIKFNVKYNINNGEGIILFSEGKKGIVNAVYQMAGKKDTGLINGTINGNILNGTYYNKNNNSVGLIEFTFNENGFDCKWKQGIQRGPMRGKWIATLNPITEQQKDREISENQIEISKVVHEKELSYEESIAKLKDIGNGWRLPNIREALFYFPEHKDIIDGDYLTSTFSANGQIWMYSTYSKGASLESDYIPGKLLAVRGNENSSLYFSELLEISTQIKNNISENQSDNYKNEIIEVSTFKNNDQFTWHEGILISKLIGDDWRLPCDADEILTVSDYVGVELYGYYWAEEHNDDEAVIVDIDGTNTGTSMCKKVNTAKLLFLRNIES